MASSSVATSTTGKRDEAGGRPGAGGLEWCDALHAWIAVSYGTCSSSQGMAGPRKANGAAAIRRIVLIGQASALRVAVNGQAVIRPGLARA